MVMTSLRCRRRSRMAVAHHGVAEHGSPLADRSARLVISMCRARSVVTLAKKTNAPHWALTANSRARRPSAVSVCPNGQGDHRAGPRDFAWQAGLPGSAPERTNTVQPAKIAWPRHDPRAEGYPGRGRTAGIGQAARQCQPSLQDYGVQPKQFLSVQRAVRQGGENVLDMPFS